MIKKIKNQKGLTLIELLAVVVILGIIAAIAIPSIGGLIDNSRKDAHAANAIQMIESAKYAVIGHTEARPPSSGDVVYISLRWLIDESYMEEVIDPDGGSYETETANNGTLQLMTAGVTAPSTPGTYVRVEAVGNTHQYSVFTNNGNRGVKNLPNGDGDHVDDYVAEADITRAKVIK